MKTLISWIAFNNDFKDGQAQKSGPTYSFHEHFYEPNGYDRHVLLLSKEEEDHRMLLLLQLLNQNFPDHKVEGKVFPIKDVIDINEVKQKVESLLMEYKEDDIDIFFSPGTSIMQLAWYICHTSLPLKTRLIQTRAAKFTKSKKPEQDIIALQTTTTPQTIIAKLKHEERQEFGEEEDHLITESIKNIYEDARKIAEAETDKGSYALTTLILGESGTGKEHLAHFIHRQSRRRDQPFRIVNCASFNDELLPSILFGHIKGSFTGAIADKKGVFEEADGGTVFLDEIGDISPFMQQSLLRVLQTGEILPLGANKVKKVNVRVIAATHRDLVEMCSKDEFRWDLYYRLTNVELTLPPLRERGMAEKEKLIHFFLKKLKKDLGKSKTLQLGNEVKEKLLHYSYPGNIRELINTLSTLYIFSEDGIAYDINRLPRRIIDQADPYDLHWKAVEKRHIEKVLQMMKGNQRQAWLALGYGSINTLRNKMQEYNIFIS